MAEKILNKISFGESAVDVYLITDSAARAHMADSAVHVAAAEKSSWNGKQDAITSSSKLDYSLLANTPSIPAVNSAVVTISQGGVSKGSFNVNASSDVSINLDAGEANVIEAITFNGSAVTVANKTAAISAAIPSALSALTGDASHRLVTDAEKTTWSGKQDAITSSSKLDYSLIDNVPSIPTVNNAVVTISQGGVSKGSFNVNAASNVSIDLDAGGGAGEANIIEAITFNGTSASVTDKVAAITVSIPTVNSPKITINQGGTSKGSFNLNQAGSSTINLDAPGESNVIEAVQLNGTNLSISNKSVNVQAITGITVNGTAATVTDGVAAITVTGGGGGEGGITLAQARRQALIFG